LFEVPPVPPQAQIIITGTALPEAKAEQVYTVERVGKRQIQQSPSHEIDQLLKDIPGAQLFRRSDARSGHPTSQGITLRALGGNASSRALLMLDGVPQTDPFGGWVNWPSYDPLDLSQIRVVRGGGSVTNGPGSLAGTIEMISDTNAGVTGGMDAGSRGSIEGRARIAVPLGGGVMSIAGRGERSDGFIPITFDTRGPADEPAASREWSARGRWVAPIGSSLEVQANLDAFRDWRTRGTDFSQNRTNGADASLRLIGRGDWQWTALAYWQWRNLMSSFASVNAGRTRAVQVSLQDSVPGRGLGGSVELRPPMPKAIELRLGADARRTHGESQELYNFVASEPTRRRFAGGETWTAGAFAEATAEVSRVTVTVGGRIDHWAIDDGHLFERIIATGAVLTDTHQPKRDGWLPTARGGASAPLAGGFTVRSAAYLGWRMPTLNELFRPFRAGSDATAANPGLSPERLAGAEVGLEFRKGSTRFSLTGFVNRLNDAIANVTLGHGPGTFPGVGFVGAGGTYYERENVEAVNVRGLEAAANWTHGAWLLQAGASWTRARMEATGAASFLNGLRPAQTPNFAATFAGGYDEDEKGAQIVIRYVGAQYDNDLNTDVLTAATTVDAYASWPLAGRLQLVGRVENLFDKNVMAGINGDGSVERATPRTLWLGLRYR
jgi:vitamin B12 transporter